MESLGWLLLLVLAIYTTFVVVAGSIINYGFTGSKLSLIELVGLTIPFTLWYGVFVYFPYVVK